MKKCFNCGAPIANDSRFCNKCGKEIPQGTVCPHCGASVNDGDAFCQNCGTKIEARTSKIMEDTTQKRCPHCGAPVKDDDAFCQNCGTKIEVSTSKTMEDTTLKRCPHCNASVNEGDAFCQNCGTKIEVSTSKEMEDTTQKRCPHCGAPVKDGDAFCQNCGAKTVASPSKIMEDTTQKRCPHCGASVKDGDIFCKNCSKRIDEAPSNNKKIIVPALIGIIVLAVIGGGWWYWTSSKQATIQKVEKQNAVTSSIEEVIDSVAEEMTPEEMIKRRVNYIYNEAPYSENFNKLYLSDELYELIQWDEEVADEWGIGFIDYDIWSHSQGGDGEPSYLVKSAKMLSTNKATAQITIKYSESKESTDIKLILIRKGDDWFIDDFISYYSGHEQSLKQELIDFLESEDDEVIDSIAE